MADFPFAPSPERGRSDILKTAAREELRQRRTLIMIPSESICHPAAAEVLASSLGNIYAEGQPEPLLCHEPRKCASDEENFQGWQTRLADRRFYKGTVNANRAELLTQNSIARIFGRLKGSPPADDIHVNVQALSGAAANQAVYMALIEDGDRIMGLDLGHGGHLTHGSQFNFSGKRYEAHSYGIDPKTRKLDYAQIRRQARESRPKVLIGGASSYPWDFDWAELRSIADEVGAYLLADIAHLAGMVAGGALANPLPHAHVVTFTTHKTLCGPRGAAILSIDPEIARKIDMAVFPGLQGGPHVNNIAAIGRLFELIDEDYEGFCRFQRQTLENAKKFAQYLAKEGFALEYGGTNTHMVLVDLKKWPVKGNLPVDGEIASRLLEIAGIVCNKNVLPGDEDAAHASGLRFGLPWLTQRGVTDAQLREIAAIVKSVLKDIRTFEVWVPSGQPKCRGRVTPEVLADAAKRALAIANTLPPFETNEGINQLGESKMKGRSAICVSGEKATLALSQMLTARLPADDKPVHTLMLRNDGSTIDDVIAKRLEPKGRKERWLLLVNEKHLEEVRSWISELSDGYLLFDKEDPSKKVDGPVVVKPANEIPSDVETALSAKILTDTTKPYFIGLRALYAKSPSPAKAQYRYDPPQLPLRKTLFHAQHVALGGKMVPFAGWEMPVQYPTGIFAEHNAVRTGAGLFDVSHMTSIEVSGDHALAFLETVLTNTPARLDPGEAQYSYILYPDGASIDDLFVYRLAKQRFIIVSNASNSDRVKDWLNAVNAHRCLIDLEMPGKIPDGPVVVRDLRDAGKDSRVQVALQGPASRAILQKLADSPEDKHALGKLIPNTFATVTLAGTSALVAHTGYTGEKVGFEIFVHPDSAPALWDTLIEAGKPLGVLPAGLGARDSTRIEAGFPLFGHEIEGDLKLSLTESGYGFVVRYHKPFFIGRNTYMERTSKSRRHLLRLQGKGRKTLRGGHVILDANGKVAGQVTSFAYVHSDMTFLVLACVNEDFNPAEGSVINGARLTPDKISGPVDEQSMVPLTVLSRFPLNEEREGWPKRYSE